MALTVVSGFLGGAPSNVLLRTTPAVAQAKGAVPVEIKAMQFTLVDRAGKPRAFLSATGGRNSALCLLDTPQNTRAAVLVTDGSESSLTLWDAARRPRALLSVGYDGSPGLELRDAAGHVAWQAP